MENADNENEELSFIALSAATKNVVRWLGNSEEERRDVKRGDKHDEKRTDKQRIADEERRDIERRIADILAMERRLRRDKI